MGVKNEPPADDDKLGGGGNVQTACDKVLMAVNLARKNPNILLIAVFEMAFGFATAYMNFYVNAQIVKKSLGDDYLGIMAAITPLTAALLSFPFRRSRNASAKGN